MKYIAPLLAAVTLAAMTPRALALDGYTAHEWGTFTSVQGGSGSLLLWNPLTTSELPSFVHNWMKPGLNRVFAGSLYNGRPFGGKGSMLTLQRMETPVIYFYSYHEMNVDASVNFPKGLITEWYPQAMQIGPSIPAATNGEPACAIRESRALWKNLVIHPPLEAQKEQSQFPQDETGSHYYAARDTDSDTVLVPSPDKSSPAESEKFLFYRGAGNFLTPLRVTVATDGVICVENTGINNLDHLFLLSIHDGQGAFESMDTLLPNKVVHWATLPPANGGQSNLSPMELNEFQTRISAQMQAALTNAGLFPREAQAMVNTWKNSWFTEEGDRVLYLLPRPWTDETLPLNLTPQPQSLVRVMVGRAEIITPKTEKELTDTVIRAAAGDNLARAQAVHQIHALGRFAVTALQLSASHAGTNQAVVYGFTLLGQQLNSQLASAPVQR